MADANRAVEAVRHFNRFYTRRIGVLERGFLRSPFSLAEVRVLYEVAHRDDPSARELGQDLGLDPGYLSRMIRHLEQRRLVGRRVAPDDARRQHLHVTARGRVAMRQLEPRQRGEVRAMLRRLSPAARDRLIEAMGVLEQVLEPTSSGTEPFTLRPPRAGDFGWVVHRHGALYAREYRYDATFEALVAQIVADFAVHADPSRERCWIAEYQGAIAGSVFLVKKSRTISQLRLLLVEPAARGLGIGARLVDECVNFARSAGYRAMVLWTQSELLAARRIYRHAGFRPVDRERHDSFGRKNLVAETWKLAL
jgi:DNA-binding MarR family transcriptional regulator/GNAT superfamily N-acetyltransferase